MKMEYRLLRMFFVAFAAVMAMAVVGVFTNSDIMNPNTYQIFAAFAAAIGMYEILPTNKKGN